MSRPVSSSSVYDTPPPFSKTLFVVNALTSSARDGLGPLASTFLLVSAGWRESAIGQVIFANLVATMAVQTLAGDIVDKTTNKRLWLSTACVVVGLMSVSMVAFPSYGAVFFTRLVQGIGSAFVPPAISGITLGVVGHRVFDIQVAINEVGNRGGYALAATGAGLLAYFVSLKSTFYVVLVSCALSVAALYSIPAHAIDDSLARGLKADVEDDEGAGEGKGGAEVDGLDEEFRVRLEGADGGGGDDAASVARQDKWQLVPDKETETGYLSLLQNRRLLLFCICVISFHFGNAAMLPLLGQLLSLDKDGREAIPLAVGTIIIGRGTMALVAVAINRLIDGRGRRPFFIFAFAALPIRSLLVVAFRGHTTLLLLTQLLDGFADGTYGVMHQVVTRDLMAGTGRFNIAIGVVTTCHMAGGALRNLVGEMIANELGYNTAFLTLGAIGLIPLVLFSLFFPETAPAFRLSRMTMATEASKLRS